MNPPLARSNLEAHLFMDLRPCGCGEARFDRASAVVELPGGGLGSRYAGACARCGTAREFVFTLPPQAGPTAAEDVRYGGAEPSELLDPGEWLWTADAYAKAAPADPHRLAAAAAAVDEVLKFVPPGGDRKLMRDSHGLSCASGTRVLNANVADRRTNVTCGVRTVISCVHDAANTVRLVSNPFPCVKLAVMSAKARAQTMFRS
jgi:hypothetical protein